MSKQLNRQRSGKSTGWDDEKYGDRWGHLNWEIIQPYTQVAAEDIIATAFSDTQNFKVMIQSTSKMYIKNLEIGNSILINESRSLTELENLRSEIKALSQENAEIRGMIEHLRAAQPADTERTDDEKAPDY